MDAQWHTLVWQVMAFVVGIPVFLFLLYQCVKVICKAWYRTMVEMKNKQGE